MLSKLQLTEKADSAELPSAQSTALSSIKSASQAYKALIKEKIGQEVEMFHAMAIPISEIQSLISKAAEIGTCEYLKVYLGLESGKQTMFILPGDKDEAPLLDAEVVLMTELPCPPRPGCQDDIILKS